MTWKIDLDAATATHDSGVVVKFTPAPDQPGAFDGTPAGLPDALRNAAPFALARLMREAGEAYIAARAARH